MKRVSTVTLGDVLQMDVVKVAAPKVLAGAESYGRQVRWVHAAEIAEIAPLLRGGDLLLSTGIALPEMPDDLRRFAESLNRSGAAGLLIELGRRWEEVPDSLVMACRALQLPLVALTREVRFAAIAQAVGERIVDQQVSELKAAQEVHDTFTKLSIAEAGPHEILEAVHRLSGAAVVLETDQHRVADYRSGSEDIDFLRDWTSRSRALQQARQTDWDERHGWLLTRVGRKDRRWGRLVLHSPEPPSPRTVALAERGAAALAMHLLHDRHRDGVVRRVHQELLLGLLVDPADPDLLARVEHAGVPVEGRQLVGLTFRPRVVMEGPRSASEPLSDITAAIVHAADSMKVPLLVSEIDRDVRVMVSMPSAGSADVTVLELCTRVARRFNVAIGAGRPARSASEIDRSLKEAQQIVISLGDRPSHRVVHRLEDVHVRGLLSLLAGDERLKLFVDRELGALKDLDRRNGSDLLDAVKALVSHPASKTDAAASMNLSRPAFYGRIERASRMIDLDLDDAEVRTSLHLALLADELEIG